MQYIPARVEELRVVCRELPRLLAQLLRLAPRSAGVSIGTFVLVTQANRELPRLLARLLRLWPFAPPVPVFALCTSKASKLSTASAAACAAATAAAAPQVASACALLY